MPESALNDELKNDRPTSPPSRSVPAACADDDAYLSPVDINTRRVWDSVSSSPIRSLWEFQGVPGNIVVRRFVKSFTDDNLLSRAAELGYYFLFALFPALVCVSAIFGLFAQSASDISVKLLHYLSFVLPQDALGMVLDTFNQTTQHASGGKLTFGLAASIWSASVGFSAIQDTLNTVYKVRETRPYWKARGSAMLVTVLLAVITMTTLASLLVGTIVSHLVQAQIWNRSLKLVCAIGIHLFFDVVCLALSLLLFATIYYFAPNVKNKRWRYLTPGAVIGIIGWILSSLALRLYLYYSNSYSLTYGSLGAVIILLTWFYITGLMLLAGAEINSEIEAAVAEKQLRATGAIAAGATTRG